VEHVDRLEAIEQIRDLKARYFRFVDCKLWEQLPALFTSDLRVMTPAGKLWMEGGANYATSLKFGLETAVSCHQGFTYEITLLDEHNASGVWAMQDVIEWPDRHPREGWKSIIGRGHYHETYRHEQGFWRIATLSLTRLRLDITWPDGRTERQV
jgi:hypothetical protein